MARLPDGWIIIIKPDKPIFKDGIVTIPTEDRELVICQNCKHWGIDPQNLPENFKYCSMIDGPSESRFFCAYGEKIEM